ncbi:MAG: 30S ribosomal protein S3 [Christensenellaceae bacterium]|nr:30S ribosomal protein S3 [Christensenellaceae bacterium]
MGQKVNPHGARVGIILPWSTRWYANKKDFAKNLAEDYKIREFLKEKCFNAGISHIDIERTASRITVFLHAAKPGLIARSGEEIVKLNGLVAEKIGSPVQINIIEIKKPETNAQLVAESIAQQLEKRISFRRAMKQAIQRSMRAGVKGIKVSLSGRVGGADIARTEHYHEGSIPLQTLRANINYGFAEAETTYGRLGVKVWIYKGQKLPAARRNPEKKEQGGK